MILCLRNSVLPWKGQRVDASSNTLKFDLLLRRLCYV